jgi:hypothetical protein
MPNRSSKRRSRDINEIAFSIVRQSTGQEPIQGPPEEPPKNAAAVELGRLGGLKGGKARAAKLSKRKRQEIAKKAAKARWNATKK